MCSIFSLVICGVAGVALGLGMAKVISIMWDVRWWDGRCGEIVWDGDMRCEMMSSEMWELGIAKLTRINFNFRLGLIWSCEICICFFLIMIMGLKLYDWKTSPVSYPVRWFQCKYIIRRFRSAQRPSIPKVRRLPSSIPKVVKTFTFHWLSPSSTALPALASWYPESFLHGAVLDWLVTTYWPSQDFKTLVKIIV